MSVPHNPIVHRCLDQLLGGGCLSSTSLPASSVLYSSAPLPLSLIFIYFLCTIIICNITCFVNLKSSDNDFIRTNLGNF